MTILFEEQPEHAGCRQPGGQRGGLLIRARLPQPAQQGGHAARIIKGNAGVGVPGQQRGGLLIRSSWAERQRYACQRITVGATDGAKLGGWSSSPCMGGSGCRS